MIDGLTCQKILCRYSVIVCVDLSVNEEKGGEESFPANFLLVVVVI